MLNVGNAEMAGFCDFQPKARKMLSTQHLSTLAPSQPKQDGKVLKLVVVVRARDAVRERHRRRADR